MFDKSNPSPSVKGVRASAVIARASADLDRALREDATAMLNQETDIMEVSEFLKFGAKAFGKLSLAAYMMERAKG